MNRSTNMTETELQAGLFIDGERVETGNWFPVHDPAAPQEVVGYAASGTQNHARKAVHAAKNAWEKWSKLDPERRAEILRDALGALEADNAQRVELLVRENGKVRSEAEIELQVFTNRCLLAAELAGELRNVRHLSPTVTRPEPTLDGPGASHKVRQHTPIPYRSEVSLMPMGVVTIIIPYNWPLAILAASLPYALIAGNTVIVKPPPTAPLTTMRTLELLAQKLPPGVLNVVFGSNEEVAPLLSDSLVSKIVFTGSTTAGVNIMKAAAEHMARVTLELGGNDPAIILDDADLDEAAIKRLTVGAFLTTGQVCMGIKRIYVHRSRYEEVVEGMSRLLSGYRVGHGLNPDTTMGPLNNKRQRDFVMELRHVSEAAGYEVREFGSISDESVTSGGYFLRPALVLDPKPKERIVVEEQFGPLLPIIRYDDVEQVIAMTNSEWAGLCSSVWTSDLDRAAKVAARLRTGTTWINNANAVAEDDRAPFGGFRQSGIGRELGLEGLLEFTEPHSVTYPE